MIRNGLIKLFNKIKEELIFVKFIILLIYSLTVIFFKIIFLYKFDWTEYLLIKKTWNLRKGSNLNFNEFSEDEQDIIEEYINNREIKNKNLFKLEKKLNKIMLNTIIIKFFCKNEFLFLDCVLFILKNKKNLKNILNLNNLNSIEHSFNSKGIYLFLLNNKNKINFFKTFLIGLKSFWKNFRLWILPVFLFFIIIYFGIILKALPFNKVIFIWISFFMMFYWLISGFVSFFKKYQFGKFTSSIQRFWKRSYIIFWLLETCLLLVFIYLTFNATQDSFHMFDQLSVYQTHLFSWRIFFLKIFPVIILINLSYSLLLMLKWNIFSKQTFWLSLMTVILTYLIWLEFYQFYHIINFYSNFFWFYDVDEKLWNLESDVRRTRMVNHYVMWLLILKFWHLLFVYVFWIFLVLRGWESQRLRYPLLSANLQNLIIVYIMSWLFMYPWFKLFLRKFLDIPYFWFYISNRSLYLRGFFNDIKIFIYGIFNKEYFIFLKNFKELPFYYWHSNVDSFGFSSLRKHYIKDQILSLLNETFVTNLYSNYFNSFYIFFYNFDKNYNFLTIFLNKWVGLY